MDSRVKITERGWPAHFICAHKCQFRRNTLVEFEDLKIVVSTVGVMKDYPSGKIETIGFERYYETMVFMGKYENPYWEADISKEIWFQNNWSLNECEHDSDLKAQEMHENIVQEMAETIISKKIRMVE